MGREGDGQRTKTQGWAGGGGSRTNKKEMNKKAGLQYNEPVGHVHVVEGTGALVQTRAVSPDKLLLQPLFETSKKHTHTHAHTAVQAQSDPSDKQQTKNKKTNKQTNQKVTAIDGERGGRGGGGRKGARNIKQMGQMKKRARDVREVGRRTDQQTKYVCL